MILCDIGNSFFHFYKSGKIWKLPNKHTPNLQDYINIKEDPIYYISVNEKASNLLLSKYLAKDISDFIALDTTYVGLGVDRAAACLAIDNGVVVDAGSAITIDVMNNAVHLGGYILPGIERYRQMYASISPLLNNAIHFDIKPDFFPQNTKDAISYGIIISLLSLIKTVAKSNLIYFTGGDGAYLSRFFKQSIVDNSLVFQGMQKAIKIAKENKVLWD